jgi:hypothetical protein
MIQRIQTLFLFLAAVLLSMLAFFPIAEFIDSNAQVYSMSSLKIEQVGNAQWVSPYQVYIVGVMLFILSAGALATLFLYKKRVIQARLSMILLMLSIVWPGIVYLYGGLVADALSADQAIQPIVVVSWLAALLFFMARRRILTDEALVKSYDRLR